MKLANLTLHSQERYKKDFAREGFDIEIEPHGIVVNGQKPEEIRKMAKEAVEDAIRRGCEGFLLGGRTDVAIYISEIAQKKGIPCFVVNTKRVRVWDRGNEFFKFNFGGVIRICISS